MVHDRSLVMVPAWVGQETCADLERQAEAGERPRSDYVELAHALDADVMDMQYLTEPAGVLGRSIARAGRLAPAQVATRSCDAAGTGTSWPAPTASACPSP